MLDFFAADFEDFGEDEEQHPKSISGRIATNIASLPK